MRALEIEFGLVPPHTDWAAYVHTTDSGITRELFEIEPRAPARSRPSSRRLEKPLRERSSAESAERRSAPGHRDAGRGEQCWPRCVPDDEWDVAIATGAWRTSALFKLRVAGIDIDGLPAAFSEDGEGRDEIVRTAWTRARSARPAAPRTLAWCRSAMRSGTYARARRLGLPFLGVAVKGSEDALRAAGATHVVPDFRDAGAVLRALAEAK